jgi:hypothetical protein
MLIEKWQNKAIMPAELLDFSERNKAFSRMKLLPREEEPGAKNQAEVARAFQRLGHRDGCSHLREVRIIGFGAQRPIPDAVRHPENFRRLAKMMREVARAQPILDREEWAREVDPIMEDFVAEEASHDAEPYRRRGPQTEDAENQYRHDRRGKPCADREHRMRVAMMLVMQRRRKGDEDVTQKAVDGVFDKRPREQPEHKHGEEEKHRDDRMARPPDDQIDPIAPLLTS